MRRRGRELAMQLLFQVDVGKRRLEEACATFDKYKRAPEKARSFALQLAGGVMGHREDIDGKIREALKHWKFDRLAAVDTQLMRIAIYEMIHCDDIPVNIAINEAIELSKIYSGDKAAKFVNGVLGNLCLKYAPGKIEAKRTAR